MSNSPSALSVFSYNWVGGDIHGLSRLASFLYEFAEKSRDPASSLKRTVDRLVAESAEPSWKGSAAWGFKSDFGRDITDIDWLSARATSIGDTLDKLSVTLAKLESWLENQAEQGVRAGFITIGFSGKIGLPKGTSDPRVQKFLQQFNQCRAQAIMGAKAARKVAAEKLSSDCKALFAGLNNYHKNHVNLLPESEIYALGQSLSGLESSFKSADGYSHPAKPDDHQKSLMKDLVEGAVITNGTIIGGIVGSIEPGAGTVAGIGVGAAVGAAVAPFFGAMFD